MSRLVALDTETTGLSPADGDRVISIGCVEIVDRRITGREWHTRLNPDGRASHPAALAVHKITDEELLAAPRFPDIKPDFAKFLARADALVIHNAPFDLGFLNAELRRIGILHKIEDKFQIIDTMRLGGQSAGGSLNRMLDKHGIDRSVRDDRHGALIDARLLAQLYLAMTRGQEQLDVAPEPVISASEAFVAVRPPILVVQPSPAELAAHEAMMADLRGAA